MTPASELFPKTTESFAKLSDTARYFARRHSRRAVRFLDSMLLHYEFYSEIKSLSHSVDPVTKKLLARELAQDVTKGLTQVRGLFNRSYEYDSELFRSLEEDLKSLREDQLRQAYESFDPYSETNKWDLSGKHKAILSEIGLPRSFSQLFALKHGTMASSQIINRLPWVAKVYKEELQQEGLIGGRQSEINPGSREVIIWTLRAVSAVTLSLFNISEGSSLSFAYGLDLAWDSVANTYRALPQGHKLREDQAALDSLL
jgi:hypothetical protein